MKTHPVTAPDFGLYLLLTEAAHAVVRMREKELRRYHLSVPQVRMLELVHGMGDKATPAELSRWMMREDHTISGILDRMDKDGLAQRVQDPDRKNGVRVVLTRKGEEAYRKSKNVKGSVASIGACLSEEDREQLLASLERIRKVAFKKLGLKERPLVPKKLESGD